MLSKRRRLLACFLLIVCAGGSRAAAATAAAAAAGPSTSQPALPPLPEVEDLGLNSKPYVQRAEKYRAERDFTSAAAYYRRAAEVDPQDPQLRITLGDVMHQLSRVDPAFAGQDRAAWESVVASHPRRKDGQLRLMNYFVELVQFGAAARYAGPLHDAAERVLRLDPADKSAQVWTHAAVIAGALASVATPADTVDQHAAALKKLWSDGIRDPNIPFYIGRLSLKQAVESRARNDAAGVARAARDTSDTIERALTDSPNDAVLRLRAAQLLQDLATLADGNQAEQQRLRSRVREVLNQAYQTVRDTDPAFTETYVAYASCLSRDGDPAGAEKVLRELLARKPNDQFGRVTLAQALHAGGQQKYPEAIALLREPITDPVESSIITYRNRRSVETLTLAELTSYLIDTYPAQTNDVARARLTAEIQQNFQKMVQRDGMTPLTLKLKGRIALMKGGDSIPEAVRLLEQAHAIWERNYPASTGYHDWELEYLLAQAYNEARQPGPAKKQLWEIVNGLQSFVPARVMLARLLIADNEIDLAREQVQKIAELSPALPELEKLKGALAAASAPARASGPTPATATSAPATTAPAPDLDAARKQIEAIADPFQREWRFYEFYMRRGDRDEALRHLDAADKVSPNHPKLLDLRFNLALDEHDWDAAGRLLDPLEKANADEAHGLIYRYRLAFAKGDLNVADSLARDLTTSFPQYARSWICHGDALKARRQFVVAIANYKTALDKQPDSIDALRGLVECEYALNHPQEARRFIEEGLRLHPDDEYLREQLVSYNLNFGTTEEVDRALAARAEAARRQPDAVTAQLAYGAAEWHVAQLCFRANRLADAQPHLRDALSIFTAAKRKWPDERMPYAYLADIAAATNDFAAGEAALQEFAARDKWIDSPDPSVLLGDYYARFGRGSLMEAAYRTAQVKLQHTRADAATNEVRRKVAAFFSAQREYDAALEVLQPAGADDPRIRQQTLEIMLAAGRLDRAEQLVDQQLAANSEDAQLWATRGYLLLQQQKANTPDAIIALDKAIAIDPHNQTALYYRGSAELRMGPTNLNDAIRDLTAARDAADAPAEGPPNPVAQIQTRIALADALRQRNQPDEAIREMEQALRLQPQSKDLRTKLIEMLGTLPEPRWDRVEQLIADAQKLSGGDRDPDWWRASSSMWLTRKDPDKAIASIRQAIQLSQGLPQQYQLPLMRDYVDILARAKRYPDLEAECSDMLRNPQFAISAWWVYQQRAVARFNLGKQEAAARDFDAALRIAGTNNVREAPAAILQSIADTLGLDQAIARAERDAAKGDLQARVLLPYEYFTRKDYPKALAAADAVLSEVSKLSDSQKQSVYGVLGSIHMLNANFPKARSAYTALLTINPDDVATLNNLAVLYADFLQPPDPRKALGYAEHAVQVLKETRRNDPAILDTYGWCLVLTDNLDAGIERLRLAQSQHETVEVDYHLGSALARKSDKAAARAELEKAIKLVDPGRTADARLKPKIEKALASLNAP